MAEQLGLGVIPGTGWRGRDIQMVALEAEMVAVARKHENVYIDTSAYTAKRYPPELVDYMKSRSGRKKVMFGKRYFGVERSTFVIDGDGRIAAAMRRVKPAAHAGQVLEAGGGI
jgi:hypothetical protein